MRFPARRRLCRLAFCTLCLLPTLLVGGVSLIVNTSAYQAARVTRWQTRLAWQLGLDVQVASVQWTARDQCVVHELELRDPESGHWLARARVATVRRGASETRVSLGQTEIDFHRAPRLVEILHEHLLLRSARDGTPMQLFAPTVVLDDPLYPATLLDARLMLETREDSAEVFLEFRSAEEAEGDRTRLRVVRNRQLDPPATGWELHTGSRGLPGRLVRAWLPGVEDLGSECIFQGSVWCERLPDGWDAEMSGTWRQLDLDRLVSARFPHKLSGLAELTLRDVGMRRGRLVRAEGRLLSSGGVISQSLLEAAEQHLGLKRFAPLTDAMLLRYCELELQFVLDENGLVVAGRDDLHRVVLADATGPLLASPDSPTVPPQALVHLLVPAGPLHVPAVKETAILLQTLPLPAITPSVPESARRDYTPLRLSQEPAGVVVP